MKKSLCALAVATMMLAVSATGASAAFGSWQNGNGTCGIDYSNNAATDFAATAKQYGNCGGNVKTAIYWCSSGGCWMSGTTNDPWYATKTAKELLHSVHTLGAYGSVGLSQ